ncbi:WhiB family redox-sensing transcriptional regulator [Catenulispora sp. MAP12-49]|uniref:WhiB family transcriptional regulator n=1 Tax=unclassified Catenulispora TaxID=414885 RepID=UPI00351223FE
MQQSPVASAPAPTPAPPSPKSDRERSWFARAACRQAAWRLFFEAEGEGAAPRARRIRAAKAVCAECPVRRECLLFALAKQERYGIWGGFTARERATIKRRRLARTSRRADRRGP